MTPERREQFRAAAAVIAAEAIRPGQSRTPRPLYAPANPRVAKPLPVLTIESRLRRFQAAVAFLAARGTAVTVIDREALVRTYRVTGKQEPRLAEEVIAVAVARGFEVQA